jgi:transcriptional regulator with XRE-family HTH domain
MSHFGKLLLKARKRIGLTQMELGRRVPIDHSYISKMEKGEFLPSREVAVKLADALGITDKTLRLKFLLEAKAVSKEDVEGAEDETAVEHGQQASATPLSTLARAAKAIPDVLFGTTGEEIDYLTESAGLTEEEEEKAAVEVVEFYKRLLTLIKTLRKSEED